MEQFRYIVFKSDPGTKKTETAIKYMKNMENNFKQGKRYMPNIKPLFCVQSRRRLQNKSKIRQTTLSN